MIRVTSTGNHNRTRKALERMLKGDMFSDLERYGQMGVQALASATPKDDGVTANSWVYKVFRGKSPGVIWYNTNMIGGTSVAILIQYGHGTGTGGYVQGRDYINPTIRPIFDKIADDVWKKVTK